MGEIDASVIWIGLAVAAVVSLAAGAVLLTVLIVRLRRLPTDAEQGPIALLRITPLWLVIVLDVLDLLFDFLSAPVAWVILGKFGLQGLRPLAVGEAIIPFTQFLPTMTVSWLAVRWRDRRLEGPPSPPPRSTGERHARDHQSQSR